MSGRPERPTLTTMTSSDVPGPLRCGAPSGRPAGGDPCGGPDGAERVLAGIRRIAVPVAAALLLLLAIVAGDAAETAAAAAAGTTRVSATVLGTTAGPGPVDVGWTDGRGVVRTATVTVGGRVAPGRTVGLWTGPDGVPAAPEHPTEVRTAGILRSATVLVVGGLLLIAVYAAAGVAGRARAAGRLDREWRAVEACWRELPRG